MANDAFQINGEAIAPGERQHLEIPVARLPTQTMLSLPVVVINGVAAGPKLWLSAAIHGDEINGVEIIRQVLKQVDPKQLRGTLIGVPIVNVFGFIEQSRYLPDRRDLNRSFPGSATGSLASRLANLFMKEIVSHCTHGIDLHTAAIHRTNLPQIRANLKDANTYYCAKAFGAPITIHSTTRDGSLREAVAERGIPILLYEAGEALRFDVPAIRHGVAGVLRVMAALEMVESAFSVSPLTVEVSKSRWVRAPRSGILRLDITLGEKVQKKEQLGVISDAFGDTEIKVRSPVTGIAIGHAQNPLVNQGDGIIHVAEIN